MDIYNGDGVLLTPHHLIAGGALNAPWGIAMAPADFGALSGDLLVGNFGDGRINVFDPTHGTFLGPLTLSNGKAFQEDNDKASLLAPRFTRFWQTGNPPPGVKPADARPGGCGCGLRR